MSLSPVLRSITRPILSPTLRWSRGRRAASGGAPYVQLGTPTVAYAPDSSGSVLDDAGFVPGWLSNVRTVLDMSGNGRHLVQTTAANQPLFLKYEGVKYIFRPPGATSGNICCQISSPTTDINATLTGHTFETSIKALAWTSASDRYIVARTNTAAAYCWALYLSTTGTLVINLSGTGVASTVAVPFAAKQRGWIKVEYIQNTGSGQYSIIFRTSTDGVTYTQLGTTLTGASLAALNNTSMNLITYLQGYQGTLPFPDCAIYSAKIWNQAGTLVSHWDAEDIALATSTTTFPLRVANTTPTDLVTIGNIGVPVVGSQLFIRSNTILPVTNPPAMVTSYKFGMVYAGRPPSATTGNYIMGMRSQASGVSTSPYTMLHDISNGIVIVALAKYWVKTPETAPNQQTRQRVIGNLDTSSTGLVKRNGVNFTGATIALASAGNLGWAYSTDCLSGVAMGRMGLWIDGTIPSNTEIDTWLDALVTP